MPRDYAADNKNWAITQTDDADIFVANNKGLLHFNGANWKLYDSPNKTTLRSVFAVGQDVYSGAYMEFGVWKKNDDQYYKYYSLSDSITLKEDEQFWKITSLSTNNIAFQSLDRIYILNLETNEYQQIDSKYGINKIYKIDQFLYYQKINEGIYKIVNGKEILVSDLDVLKNNLIINLYKIDGEIYAQTENNGILSLHDGTSYIPLNHNELWNSISVYNSFQSEDGAIYMGTIAHGLIKLKNHQIKYNLNREKGLSNNTVLSLFEDHNKNIWLGLDTGINYVDNNSALKIFNDYEGFLGTVYATFKHKENLYIGTNQGLFIYDTEKESFYRIPETSGQVWSLYVQDGTLFCGHNNGTYIVRGNTAELISDIPGTWTFKKLGKYIIQGNYDGIHVLQKTKDGWEYLRKIKGINISTKYFEFISDRELLVNHEYKGVYKLELNKSFTEVLDIEKIDSAPKGLYSSIINHQGEIIYAFQEGIFTYSQIKNEFIKNEKLSKIYENDEYVSGRLIKDQEGNIWTFTKNDIVQIIPSSIKNEYKIRKFPISYEFRSQIAGDENVSLINKNTYLFGNTKGYFQLDIDKFKPPKTFIEIDNVYEKSRNKANRLSKLEKENRIPYANNNLDIHFSTTNYDPFYKTEYQYQLKGYDSSWSNWSTDSEASFKNLSFGNYTFNVRSRIGTDNISQPRSFSFTISRPFYLSNLMLIVYGICLLLLIIITHFLYKSYYKRQQKILELQTQRELRFKETEAERKIIQISNEKLKQDIENKNNELAISTMSLIKKNEFLSHIKNDLSEIKNKDSKLKRVINIINKNLNSTDDWKFFEEAFNNADKDFLKKMKQKHPILTPDDLKLCAYLRLNLSSKEIAPLFNISTRSVEVKRYRLRKKMGLTREQNLIDYIINI